MAKTRWWASRKERGPGLGPFGDDLFESMEGALKDLGEALESRRERLEIALRGSWAALRRRRERTRHWTSGREIAVVFG